MAFGAKQLRTECYLRQLRIVKRGPDANDHKSGYVALLMQQKPAFSEMQRLGVEEGPAKRGVVGSKRRTRHCMLRLLNVIKKHILDGFSLSYSKNAILSSPFLTKLQNYEICVHDNDFFSFCSGKIDVLETAKTCSFTYHGGR
ncbi:uncharacterized protein PITG_15488 [Phytophthora infestans T30-4]|uniref:Uncharacterized protein n=1 Tax=Phytophthora infestans (strain T30-4) TaxID=403677 RepID=D0NRD1_PHYIT|nr:uncharacterized protein PITG_15488 [Phytophthora infestans T30-4]EEY63253.1 conserved hypothetical protein [Phytophthora infestans T30-4]|eukprot:XP_002898430.1 conserved hypothetical protein [Phytophthora infestans T30-4]